MCVLAPIFLATDLNMTIKLFITGGTIDKTYNLLNGELAFNRSHIAQILAQSRTSLEITTELLLLKDSLAMTAKDRELILSKCLECDEKNIMITHGTDTMVKTAKLLSQAIKNKTIVLFGAMLPYSVKHSDALFNFGAALNTVQTQKAGVYIAMHGEIFNPDKVKKNKKLGVFQHRL